MSGSTLASEPSDGLLPLHPSEAGPGAGLTARGPLTTFLGREREMAEIRQLLAKTRLLTLIGAGGCGKTRLALEIAAELLPSYPDGVGLVELASVSDPALLAQSVALSLEIREEPQQSILTTLVTTLGSQRLLLVLDNCEHLIEACSRLADLLLRHCPGLQILATSREPLGIGGELSWRVPSLSVPQPEPLPPFERFVQYAGVRLFAERAAAVLPSFRVTPDNAPAVAQVCYRLDGIPLALELAAARVRALSVAQIAARLDDQFRLLTGGSRIDVPRHQTLRALVDWSYDLLSEPERRLFHRLSVFAGSWSLEAAEAVCAGEGIPRDAVLDLLVQLVDKSLVLVDHRDGEVRYRFLETLHQYATEKLRQSDERSVFETQHLNWCLALASQAESELGGPDGTVWIDRLEAEQDNFQIALERSLAAEALSDPGLQLAAALWWYWELRGDWSRGRRWLERLLSATQGRSPTPERVKALHGAASLADLQGDRDQAGTLLEEALSLHRELGDTLGVAFTLNRLGQMAFRLEDYRRSQQLIEESLALFRALGDPALIADALDTLGNVVRRQGNHTRAAALFEESLALCRDIGDQRGMSAALRSMVHLAADQGDHARAAALAAESVAHSRAVGDTFGLGAVLLAWAHAAVQQGDLERAEELIEEGLTIQREAGEKLGFAIKLRVLADVVQRRGDYRRAVSVWQESLKLHAEMRDLPAIAECLAGLARLTVLGGTASGSEQAVRLFAAATALSEGCGVAMAPADPAESTRLLAAARAELGDQGFAAAWEAGRELSLERAIAEALALEIMPAESPPAPEPASETGPRAAGLTRRELEVLRLVVLGNTNDAIAAELVISISTVERHISNIYAKIGARARADAVAFAIRHGLAD